MLDIKLFRENPELIKKNLKKKFKEEKIKHVDEVISKDKKMRVLMKESEALRHRRNELSQKISEAKKNKKDASKLLTEAKDIPKKIIDIESEIDKLQKRGYQP